MGGRRLDRSPRAASPGTSSNAAAGDGGGLHTDWASVPDWADIGYPIVECREDGSFVVTKPPQTGGLVHARDGRGAAGVRDRRSDQLPACPNVVCDFRQVRMEQAGPHRVLVTGARGRPRPAPTGQRDHSRRASSVGPVTIVGIDAPQGPAHGEALIERGALDAERGVRGFRRHAHRLLGTESAYGPHSDGPTRESLLRLTVSMTTTSRRAAMFSRESSPAGKIVVAGTTARAGVFGIAGAAAVRLARREGAGDADVHPGESDRPVTMPPPQPQRAGTACALADHTAARPAQNVPLVQIAFGRSGGRGQHLQHRPVARDPALLPV